jgi:hypothetical protein
MYIHALSDVSCKRIINSGIWPTRSPDLNPSKFFFWGCLNDNIDDSNPGTEELKENIRREIAKIYAERLQIVNEKFSAGARNVYM